MKRKMNISTEKNKKSKTSHICDLKGLTKGLSFINSKPIPVTEWKEEHYDFYWKQWKKTEIENAIETLKCRASISCRDGKKEVNAFSLFYITWCDYLDSNPLVKKKMDPFYVLMSFNGLECSVPPQNLDQIILDYNKIKNVEKATKVDGSSYLYAFSNLENAISFDMYVRGRLNVDTYVSRVFSSNDMVNWQ